MFASTNIKMKFTFFMISIALMSKWNADYADFYARINNKKNPRFNPRYPRSNI